MINFNCSECGASLKAKDEFAGRVTKCRTCGVRLSVPHASSASEPKDKAAANTPMVLKTESVSSRSAKRASRDKMPQIIGSVVAAVFAIGLIYFFMRDTTKPPSIVGRIDRAYCAWSGAKWTQVEFHIPNEAVLEVRAYSLVSNGTSYKPKFVELSGHSGNLKPGNLGRFLRLKAIEPMGAGLGAIGISEDQHSNGRLIQTGVLGPIPKVTLLFEAPYSKKSTLKYHGKNLAIRPELLVSDKYSEVAIKMVRERLETELQKVETPIEFLHDEEFQFSISGMEDCFFHSSSVLTSDDPRLNGKVEWTCQCSYLKMKKEIEPGIFTLKLKDGDHLLTGRGLDPIED